MSNTFRHLIRLVFLSIPKSLSFSLSLPPPMITECLIKCNISAKITLVKTISDAYHALLDAES